MHKVDLVWAVEPRQERQGGWAWDRLRVGLQFDLGDSRVLRRFASVSGFGGFPCLEKIIKQYDCVEFVFISEQS